MAGIDSESLDKYLVQVRRIAESREKDAEKQILKLYKELVKELNGFLGNEYAKYAEDDRLTYGILQRNGEYARFLEEVNKKVDSVIPKVKSAVEGLVNETYEKCWQGMIDGVSKCKTVKELHDEFKAIRAVRPEVVKKAVQNPIPKLRLTPTLERNRKQVISGIKREIAVGLSQGDRMSTMAERINKKVGTNYNQSMLIARTEAHRVRESGLNDAASEVDEILKENGSEYRKVKTWNTCEDSSVRDTHKRMDGKTVLQDEKFILPSGVTAECPGTSGSAAEDCNCRCFLTHDIVTDAEFFELTGKHFPDYEKRAENYDAKNSQNRLTNADESGTIELERNKNYTHRKIGEDGQQIIDKPTYNKLTEDFVKHDGIIIRGEEAKEHLTKLNAYASYLPSLNSAYIRDDATVSDVLEEMYHAKQDRENMFGGVLTKEVVLRREIDAQKYLLSVVDKYNIPNGETETTKSNLAYYENKLKALLEGTEK